MKYLLSLLMPFLLCSGAEFVLFPGKTPLKPMTGFSEFRREGDVLVVKQSRNYSWTALLPVQLKTADYSALSVRLQPLDGQPKGAFTLYFRSAGSKKLAPENYCRIRFACETQDAKELLLKLDQKRWKGDVDALRFDISGAAGTRWRIDSIKLLSNAPEPQKKPRKKQRLLQQSARPQGKYWSAAWLNVPGKYKCKDAAFYAFRKEFSLPAKPLDARLQLSADDGFRLYVNGESVFRKISNWQNPAVLDITKYLKQGSNTIEIRTVNFSGPGGVVAEGTIFLPEGKTVSIRTDNTWHCGEIRHLDQKNAADTLQMAEEHGNPPCAPWGAIPFREFRQRTGITPVHCDMRYQNGVLSGTVTIRENVPELFLALCGRQFPLKHYTLPVRNGKAELNVKLALPYGSYQLVCDEEKMKSNAPFLRFSVPAPAPEKLRCQMVEREGGGMQFCVNGKPAPFQFFKGGMLRAAQCCEEGGVPLLFTGMNLTVSDGSSLEKLWPKPGPYRFEKLDQHLESLFQLCPNAKVILCCGMDAPRWWAKQHPDECVRFEKGTKPEGLSSPASTAWRQEAAKLLTALIRHCEKGVFSSRIVGYRIQAHCSGGEFQYFGTWQRKHADYSPAMQAYFRAFLKKRYGTDAQLQKAWHDPAVTLETAAIPAGAKRSAKETGIFRDLDRVRDVSDFQECLSDAMLTFAADFLKIVRREAPGKLAGMYGGYVFYYGGFQLLNSGHVNFRDIYRTHLLDFICSPNDYLQRDVGSAASHHGPSTGTALYHIAYLDENDTRTHLCPPNLHRKVSCLRETLGVLNRDFALQLTKGLGNCNYDLGGGWLADTEIQKTLRQQNRIAAFAAQEGGFRRARAVLLYSAESITRLSEKNDAVTDPVRRAMRRNLGASGVPVDLCLLEDVLEENFPEYDCYILPNAFAPSDAVRQAVEKKLKKTGKTLVFGYAPGAFRGKEGGISPQAMKEWTGMDIQWRMEPETRSMQLVSGEKAGSGVKLAPSFRITEKAAECRGKNPVSGACTYAAKKMPGNWTSIVSMVPELTTSEWRNIFRKAGIAPLTESGDPAYYDGRFLAIHAASDGMKTLRLPRKANVYDLLHERCAARDAETLTLPMKRGDTALFYLGDDAGFRRFLQTEPVPFQK